MKIPFALLPVLAILGCGKHEVSTVPPQTGPAVQVSVTAAAQVTWPDTYEAVGTVRARTSSVISSRMMGYVREVKVRVGDHVAPGQLLVVLDGRDLETHSQQAQAALTEAKSALPEADNAIAAARAQLDLAETTFRRMKELFDKRSISNQEYDEAAVKLKVAQANYALAQAKPAQLTARIQQNEQALRASEIARGYAEITAPFAGIVVEKPVEPGILANPGLPLMTIEQEGAWRLEAALEESKLPLVRAGQAAEVFLEAVQRSVQGHISEIVPTVDAGSRSFVIKIDLPVVPQLRGGQFGRARFAFGQRGVMAIPARAVREQGQLQIAFVASGDTARARMITTGEKRGEWVEVLSGMNPGETVINPPPPFLADGAKIEVRP